MNKFHWKEPDIPWRTLMPGVYIKTLRHVENKYEIGDEIGDVAKIDNISAAPSLKGL